MDRVREKLPDIVPNNSVLANHRDGEGVGSKEEGRDKEAGTGHSPLNFKVDPESGQEAGHPEAPERSGPLCSFSHSLHLISILQYHKDRRYHCDDGLDSHPLCKVSHVTKQAMYLDLPPS